MVTQAKELEKLLKRSQELRRAPRLLTKEQAKEEFGLDIAEDWLLKLTPVGEEDWEQVYVSPKGEEWKPEDIFVSEDRWITRAEKQAQEAAYTAGVAEYEVAKQTFSKVFPEIPYESLEGYSEEDWEALATKLQQQNRTPETEALLYSWGASEADIEELYAPAWEEWREGLPAWRTTSLTGAPPVGVLEEYARREPLPPAEPPAKLLTMPWETEMWKEGLGFFRGIIERYGEAREEAREEAAREEVPYELFDFMGTAVAYRDEKGNVYAFNKDKVRLFETDPPEFLNYIYSLGRTKAVEGLLKCFGATDEDIDEMFGDNEKLFRLVYFAEKVFGTRHGTPEETIEWATTDTQAFIEEIRTLRRNTNTEGLMRALGFSERDIIFTLGGIPKEGFRFMLPEDETGVRKSAILYPNYDVRLEDGTPIGSYVPSTGQFNLAPPEISGTAWWQRSLGFFVNLLKMPAQGWWMVFEVARNPWTEEDYWDIVATKMEQHPEVPYSWTWLADSWMAYQYTLKEIYEATPGFGIEVPKWLGGKWGIKGWLEAITELPLWLAIPSAVAGRAWMAGIAAKGGVRGIAAQAGMGALDPIVALEVSAQAGLRYGIGVPIKYILGKPIGAIQQWRLVAQQSKEWARLRLEVQQVTLEELDKVLISNPKLAMKATPEAISDIAYLMHRQIEIGPAWAKIMGPRYGIEFPPTVVGDVFA